MELSAAHNAKTVTEQKSPNRGDEGDREGINPVGATLARSWVGNLGHVRVSFNEKIGRRRQGA